MNKQSDLARFESNAFNDTPGDDEQTNPGVFGKKLASWIAAEIGGGVPRAEDFGCCVPMPQDGLYVACASGDAPDVWQVFVFEERKILGRLFGKKSNGESVDSLFGLYSIEQVMCVTSPLNQPDLTVCAAVMRLAAR